MKPFLIDAVKVVNLTDIFLTREKHASDMRKTSVKISVCQGAAIILSMAVGCMAAALVEQKNRIDTLEEHLNKKDEETAG